MSLQRQLSAFTFFLLSVNLSQSKQVQVEVEAKVTQKCSDDDPCKRVTPYDDVMCCFGECRTLDECLDQISCPDDDYCAWKADLEGTNEQVCCDGVCQEVCGIRILALILIIVFSLVLCCGGVLVITYCVVKITTLRRLDQMDSKIANVQITQPPVLITSDQPPPPYST